MCQDEHAAAVAAFISTKGVTRCPTACAFPTQGAIATADRVALESYFTARQLSRERRIAARRLIFSGYGIPVSAAVR
jgi:hypothetical protein